ncbi:uncharacterized protein LOC132284177 isoform X2 [Cornus florida]|uniref:uncharacterized protein LOC132284177 isoform X2 n=1 Tax=Cornus florida TaxID=4283 RepID=UPI00289EDAF3|nr:uncharacterized protein LOC132284177 isoform X2 [Cornus florida]
MGPPNTESNQKSSTTELASRYGEKDVPGSRSPELEHSNHDVPVSTVMERPGDSKYRIPSSVFARTKSTTPMEWSVASNESLFSIHMGNMSFSRDPMFLRSGELGMSGETFPSGQFFSIPPNSPPIDETTNNGKRSEAAAVGTMKEVIREGSEDQSRKKSPLAPSISHRSDESSASVKSFAFPILAGDIDKGVSVKMGGSVRVAPEPPHSRQQQPPSPKPQPQPKPEPEPTNSSTTPDKPKTKWFPCFPCCSCC